MIFLICDPVTFFCDLQPPISNCQMQFLTKWEMFSSKSVAALRRRLSGRHQGIHSVVMGGEGGWKGSHPFLFYHLSKRESNTENRIREIQFTKSGKQSRYNKTYTLSTGNFLTWTSVSRLIRGAGWAEEGGSNKIFNFLLPTHHISSQTATIFFTSKSQL